MSKKQTAGELGRFCLVGGLATIANYVIYRLCGPTFGRLLVPFFDAGTTTAEATAAAARAANAGLVAADILGYVISFFCINFPLTARYTFHAKATVGRLFGMMGAHAVNLGLREVFLLLFVAGLGIDEKVIAPLTAYTLAFLVNFTLIKRVFREPKTS